MKGYVSITLAAAALAAAGAAGGVSPQARAASDTHHRTALTVVAVGCEGCTVQLHQAQTGPQGVQVWSSRRAEVAGGKAVITVPSRRTFGSTMTLEAPWEGQLGYLTTVVMRYDGKVPGDPVSALEAAAGRRANACWEGTRQSSARLDVAVEQTTVRGVHGEVAGTRAWLPTTTVWTGEARRARHGVLGSQDFDVCRG